VNRPGGEPPHVVVALSGGVDSSTAAALLVQQGYRVSGVTMRLWRAHDQDGPAGSHSGAPSAAEDAHRVCDRLGIPFHVVDLRDLFRAHVVDRFCAEYARARTPNPCLVCNREFKFGALLRLATDWGADYLATGHYARTRLHEGLYQLLRGVDKAKDQSYVLYTLGQQQLRHVLFPLGEYTKQQVRALAEQFELPTAKRPESQDACFIPDGDYRSFVAEQRPETMRPGPIVDREGGVLGEHRGIAFYTIGQRQGMGIAARQPLYVLEIDATRNALIVGPKAGLLHCELLAEAVSFVSGNPPPGATSITAKIRYKAQEAAAILEPLPGQRARVVFAEPQTAITPGQGVVFYQDEIMLGGGIIASAGSTEV
jgi:tRNA-specific 2-thiouridylase